MTEIEHNIEEVALTDSNINVFADPGFVAGNTRTLEFLTNNLGKNIDLMLMFEPPAGVGKLYVNEFPVCWKVVRLHAAGINQATVEYTAKTAFIVPEVKSGNLVAASNSQPCETGEQCEVLATADDSNYITPAKPGSAGLMKCANKTTHPADIGIGFANSAGTKINPVLLWQDIAVDSTLVTELTPKLKIYAVSDYKETQLIKGDVESPLLWEKNLIGLRKVTELTVLIDPASGKVKIDQA